MPAPSYLTPPEQIFRWARIEHADGQTRDWNYRYIPDHEWSQMTQYERAWSEYDHDANIFLWAARIQEGQSHGIIPPVVRIVAEWTGPVGSTPPLEVVVT